jgi:hypothetical protein
MANTTLLTLGLMMGCTKPAPQVAANPGSQAVAPAAPAAETPASTVPGVAPMAPASATAAVRNQPPHIKLKLGHYRNDQLGIGVTIDLTEMTENVADIDPAKLRFDGETKVWKLQGQHGPHGRIDYLDGKRVVLQVWDNGRRAVYIPDPDTGRSSDEIYVRRDGDADPL